MEYNEFEVTIESLAVQRSQLEAALREEESHIWKNMIRIEQLKKEKQRHKDMLLRRNLQIN